VLATKSSRLTAGVAAACVAVLAITWFLLIAPRRADAAAFREQQVSATQANTVLRAKVAQLRAQAETLSTKEQELAALRKQMPPTADLPALVRTVSTLSTAAGVSLRSIKPGIPTALGAKNAAANGVIAVPLTLEATGDYFQAVAFLRQLQTQMSRILLVKSIKIDADAGETAAEESAGGKVKLAVDGQVFVLSDGAAGAAAPAATGTSGAASAPAGTTTSASSSNPVSS
jgi:type IV pilus assembly protein PilO